jgi:hypothetical protein
MPLPELCTGLRTFEKKQQSVLRALLRQRAPTTSFVAGR